MTPRNDNPISSETHQQLLRMHCEEPVNTITAADRCGISLTQFVDWLKAQGKIGLSGVDKNASGVPVVPNGMPDDTADASMG